MILEMLERTAVPRAVLELLREAVHLLRPLGPEEGPGQRKAALPRPHGVFGPGRRDLFRPGPRPRRNPENVLGAPIFRRVECRLEDSLTPLHYRCECDPLRDSNVFALTPEPLHISHFFLAFSD